MECYKAKTRNLALRFVGVGVRKKGIKSTFVIEIVPYSDVCYILPFDDQLKLKIKWFINSLQKCAIYAQKCAQNKKRCVVRKRAIGLQMSDAWCLFRGFLTTHTYLAMFVFDKPEKKKELLVDSAKHCQIFILQQWGRSGQQRQHRVTSYLSDICKV